MQWGYDVGADPPGAGVATPHWLWQACSTGGCPECRNPEGRIVVGSEAAGEAAHRFLTPRPYSRDHFIRLIFGPYETLRNFNPAAGAGQHDLRRTRLVRRHRVHPAVGARATRY